MIQIKDNVYWIAKKDWDLRLFHGHELSTHRGSTYNSYIIKDEKNVLVDTVWYPYQYEFDDVLAREIGHNNIDYIIINHNEPDHGGSLGYIMEKIPNATIVCTKQGKEIIKRHFHKDWNFKVVKTGDTLSIGSCELVFVEMTMIHWPDSMMTFVKGPNVLLSNDAFGQHYAAAGMFNDEVDSCEIYQEALKYFANILAPYTTQIKKKLVEVKALNLPIEVIAPSHGVLWRDNPMQIVEAYEKWADSYHENIALIIYDTMYESTKRMADAIAIGLENKGVRYKMFNSSITDKSDLVTEMFKAQALIFGCCTVNNHVTFSIGGLLEELSAFRFKEKLGAGFGSYGWSGEGGKIITRKLQEAGIDVVKDPIQIKFRPTHEELQDCVAFGEEIGDIMIKRRK